MKKQTETKELRRRVAELRKGKDQRKRAEEELGKHREQLQKPVARTPLEQIMSKIQKRGFGVSLADVG